MIAFLLFIISLVLFTNYLPIAIIFITIEFIRFKTFRENAAANLLEVAHAVDVAGNVLLAPFLNACFVKEGGYHYGLRGETISSATGKNWVLGKLTFLGLGLVALLNRIDKDHCWYYIDGDMQEVYFKLGKPPLPGWEFAICFLLAFAFTFKINLFIYTCLLNL